MPISKTICRLSEDMFAMADRPLWTGPGNIDSTVPPRLQHMFALARKMGYEMRPIARRLDNMHQTSGSPRAPYTPNQGYHPPFQPVRDYFRIKCFSCGHFGHTQARCPKPDSTIRINRPVGTCNVTVNSIRTTLQRSETLFRPGPHPYRSDCTPSGLHFIFAS